jgi:SAM-dependent methyltransferase
MVNTPGVYAEPREVTSLDECLFYHTMELPGIGLVGSDQWDLRGGVDEYLGHVDFHGKRVLEVGTASGFLCFEMEKRGAEVVAYDLSEEQSWDMVPFWGSDQDAAAERRRNHIRRLNNSWWLTHRILQSHARMVYGSVYEIPDGIGPVDISTFGSVLLHVRDPLLALQKAARLTTETIVVTDLVWPLPAANASLPEIISAGSKQAHDADAVSMWFYPDPDTPLPDQKFTWWHLSPELIVRFLKLLGFSRTRLGFHVQKSGPPPQPASIWLFTVVGERTE